MIFPLLYLVHITKSQIGGPTEIVNHIFNMQLVPIIVLYTIVYYQCLFMLHVHK